MNITIISKYIGFHPSIGFTLFQQTAGFIRRDFDERTKTYNINTGVANVLKYYTRDFYIHPISKKPHDMGTILSHNESLKRINSFPHQMIGVFIDLSNKTFVFFGINESIKYCIESEV